MLNQARLSHLLDVVQQLAAIVPCGLAFAAGAFLTWRWWVWALEVEDEE